MSRDNQLQVSEIFYSLQGEGVSAGKPSVFLRLSGCNLLCKSELWECDTLALWQKGEWLDIEVVVDMIKSNTAWAEAKQLVITGGCPLIQSVALKKFILKIADFFLRIEIETNGTLPPLSFDTLKEKWIRVHYNVSPKLASSGIVERKRLKREVLKQLVKEYSIFKFVISNQADIDEMLVLLSDIKVPVAYIYLMPAGKSQDELEKTKQFVWYACMRSF
jgi:7-carboxy-7-deazaguanine synthase